MFGVDFSKKYWIQTLSSHGMPCSFSVTSATCSSYVTLHISTICLDLKSNHLSLFCPIGTASMTSAYASTATQTYGSSSQNCLTTCL